MAIIDKERKEADTDLTRSAWETGFTRNPNKVASLCSQLRYLSNASEDTTGTDGIHGSVNKGLD